MTTRGLLVRLEARAGKDEAVADFLRSALPLVQAEAGTSAWFALRFGRSDYGIFDVFPDDAARDAHLNGAVAQALRMRADELFVRQPRIERVTVLADKLGHPAEGMHIAKGLLLCFKARSGHAEQVEQFLRDAQQSVQQEPKTIAWFALQMEAGGYGIFDVFPDNGGRFSHLTGHVPRELAKHALSLLGGMPDMDMLDVLADKMPAAISTAAA